MAHFFHRYGTKECHVLERTVLKHYRFLAGIEQASWNIIALVQYALLESYISGWSSKTTSGYWIRVTEYYSRLRYSCSLFLAYAVASITSTSEDQGTLKGGCSYVQQILNAIWIIKRRLWGTSICWCRIMSNLFREGGVPLQ